MTKKLTYEFVKESFEKEGYTLLSKEYTDSIHRLDYICSQGHKHSIIWSNWSKGHRCPFCAGVAKYTVEEIKKKFEEEGYILLSTVYKGVFSKLKYKCPVGHIGEIVWHDWIGKCRCKECSIKRRAIKRRKNISTIKESFEKEKYTLISTEYKNAFTKLECLCPKNHKHSIVWNDWQQGHRCPTCDGISKSGSAHPNWKGGIKKLNLPAYDTYAQRLAVVEDVREFNKENMVKLLEVKCSKCGDYFVPTIDAVVSRIKVLNGKSGGEHRFYCSQKCKDTCEVYGKRAIDYISIKQQKENVYTKEELSIWSQEVLKRADYKCEGCGAEAEHAHHIQPKKIEPGLALDPDNGLAVCKACHYKYGHKNECSTGKLANTICK